jgi:hypothetical protein
MEKTLEEKLKDVENHFEELDRFYSLEENIIIQGKKIRYAFYHKNGNFAFGISQETYEKYKDEIEQAKARGLEKKHKRELKESWIVKALTDNIVTQVAEDWETGIVYYKLTAQIPKDIWSKISRYFQYYRESDWVDSEFESPDYLSSLEKSVLGLEDRPTGWLTPNYKEVSEILKEEAEKVATQEHLEVVREIEKRRQEISEERKKDEQKQEERKALLQEILKEFESAEYPDPSQGQIKLEGEVIENPFVPETIFGTGEWFVIGKDWIWYVRNNGMDGDDWSRNNVYTGGAGGIGVRIRYNEEIANKIRRLKD